MEVTGESQSQGSLPQKIGVENITSEDIIIVLLGSTGEGKSTFINTAIGASKATVGDGLVPCTNQVECFKCSYPGDKQGRNVVFVDTPAFNNNRLLSRSELERQIARWMMEVRDKKLSIAGILFMQRTDLPSIPDPPLIHLQYFQQSYGRSPSPTRIALVMNRWDSAGQDTGRAREEAIREYWKEMSETGSPLVRFENTAESAWRVVADLLAEGTGETKKIQVIPSRAILGPLVFHSERSMESSEVETLIDEGPTPENKSSPGRRRSSEPGQHLVGEKPLEPGLDLGHSDRPRVVSHVEENENSISSKDIIIAVMGPTGSGKSSFINLATGHDQVVIGHNLQSCTHEVQAFRCPHPIDSGCSVVFIDTPGFDDTNMKDTDVLQSIADWLAKTYKDGMLLMGLLFLHRITDNRMAGTPLRNLHMFERLCGAGALQNVVLVTTMWGDVQDEAIGIVHEEELKTKYWSSMLNAGSRTLRFEHSRQSAWTIVDHFTGTPVPVQLQVELVDEKKSLWQAAVGSALYHWQENLITQLRELLTKLVRKHAKSQEEAATRERLERLKSQNKKLIMDLRRPSRVPEQTLGLGSSRDPANYDSWTDHPPTSEPGAEPSRGGKLATIILALRHAQDIANTTSFTPLRGAVGLSLTVAESVQAMKATDHIHNGGVPDDTQITIQDLITELEGIQRLVTRKSSHRGRGRQHILRPADSELVRVCTERLHVACHFYEISNAINTRDVVARIEARMAEQYRSNPSRTPFNTLMTNVLKKVSSSNQKRSGSEISREAFDSNKTHSERTTPLVLDDTGSSLKTRGPAPNTKREQPINSHITDTKTDGDKKGIEARIVTESNSAGLADIVTKLESVFGNINQYRLFLSCKSQEVSNFITSVQLLESPTLKTEFRHNLVVATQRLAKATNLYPKCFVLEGVELIGDHPVAAGGFADIHRGRVKEKSVCLKVIRLYQDSEVDLVMKTFYREAILWGQLSHPNLLPFYGIYRFQNRLCLVSPWVENGNINSFLRRNPCTNRTLLALDIATGISYLHANDIIHGDLKGPNILVDNSGRAQLANIGLSAVTDPTILAWTSHSVAASKGGSTRWQAPELFSIEDDEHEFQPENIQNSKASDIYAWACVCYETFTGWTPFFELRRDATVMSKVSNGTRPSRPYANSPSWVEWGLTEAIWSLMQDCWKEDPTQRPSADAITVQLSSALDDDTRPIGGWGEISLMQSQDTVRRQYPSVAALDAMLWGRSTSNDST